MATYQEIKAELNAAKKSQESSRMEAALLRYKAEQIEHQINKALAPYEEAFDKTLARRKYILSPWYSDPFLEARFAGTRYSLDLHLRSLPTYLQEIGGIKDSHARSYGTHVWLRLVGSNSLRWEADFRGFFDQRIPGKQVAASHNEDIGIREEMQKQCTAILQKQGYIIPANQEEAVRLAQEWDFVIPDTIVTTSKSS